MSPLKAIRYVAVGLHLAGATFAFTTQFRNEAIGNNRLCSSPSFTSSSSLAASDQEIEQSIDISIPYDAAAKLAYEKSEKSMLYTDFKIKYEADAVADVIAKQPGNEKEVVASTEDSLIEEPEVIDVSIPYDAAAQLAYEGSDKSISFDAFKEKYEEDAVAAVIAKQPSKEVESKEEEMVPVATSVVKEEKVPEPTPTPETVSVPEPSPSPAVEGGALVEASTTPTFVDEFQEDVKAIVRIFQESREEGYGWKQTIANMIAGEYDAEAVGAKIDEGVKSAPCVMFTWESSPSCKKAISALEVANANFKIIRLDDPWSEGNPMRAELGKRVGRSAVPFVFIDGKYVGGFDGGSSDDAPGLVDLAFKGELRPMLEKAGAM